MAVGNMDDLRALVGKFTSVKFLEVALHGSPGMIHLANGGAMVGSYLGTLLQGAPFLQKDARILFASCDIAKGETGDRFMSELAKKMLIGKGGTIGASTVSNVVFFPKARFALGAYLSAFSDGTLKVRRYDVNGNQIGERIVDRYGKQV
jgi:hypothetical protein